MGDKQSFIRRNCSLQIEACSPRLGDCQESFGVDEIIALEEGQIWK